MIRKKVLIVAYACEPNKTSEPGVGWNFIQEIAKFMDVTVITRANNKSLIELENNLFNIKFIYYDLPKWATKNKNKIPFGIQIYYVLWLNNIYRFVKRLLKDESQKFDLLHHLTFGTTKNVPNIYGIKVPFIWGPIGGGDTVPYSFIKTAGLKVYFEEFFYRLMHWKSNISPTAYYTRKRAAAISFRTNSSMSKFPKVGCASRYLISETALPDKILFKGFKEINSELNTICVGRLIFGKGYIYAVRGFHHFLKCGGKGKLIFLGSGPEEKKLKAYVIRNKLDAHVSFKGFVTNQEVKTHLENNHVLLHPSFREGGSWTIMEAMSYGLPVICLNTSGPKDMVTNNCGLLIDLSSPEKVIKDIGAGLLMLSQNKETFQYLSKNAVNRIKNEYNWDRRREQIKQLYDEVLDL